MKTIHSISVILTVFLLSCTGQTNGQPQQSVQKTLDEQHQTARPQRLAPPRGYEKVKLPEGSFASFLRHLPLKEAGSDLHYYNGSVKQRNYDGAVVDVDFGYGVADQCADAVIY